MLLTQLRWQQLAHSGTLARICACWCACDSAALSVVVGGRASTASSPAEPPACSPAVTHSACAPQREALQQHMHNTQREQQRRSYDSTQAWNSTSSATSGSSTGGILSAALQHAAAGGFTAHGRPGSSGFSTSATSASSSSSEGSSNMDRSSSTSTSSSSSADVLKEVLVGRAATVKARAYHVGARIHIGRLVTQFKEDDRRVTAGKDYAMVWLKSSAQQPSASGGCELQLMHQHDSEAGLGPRRRQEGGEDTSVQLSSSSSSSSTSTSSSTTGSANADLSAPAGFPKIIAPYIMVAYRYGSVVFFGGSTDQDKLELQKLQQQSQMFYAAGRDVEITDPPTSKETLTLYINPMSPCWVAKRQDAVVLKQLDVGNARVVSSILSKSVALDFYRSSVDSSLQRFNSWKLLTKPRNATVFSSSHDKTLFRVMAASNLVIVEARGLLEVVSDAAWKYEVYDEVWKLLSHEYELKDRFSALEQKLRQIEEEASFDIGIRHERRYGKLERMVIWLLVVSVTMSLVELVLELSVRALGGKPAQAAHHGDEDGHLDKSHVGCEDSCQPAL